MNDIGIVILAAGASSRFGSPKQLAAFEGQSLIQRITKTALSTGAETTVVLGANAQVIAVVLRDLQVELVINSDWESGMSSSIKTGINQLLDKNPEVNSIIILLCDQPFITRKNILDLVKTQTKTGKAIVASEYAGTLGTPALFTMRLFEELISLNGDRGAKPIIEKYKDRDVAVVSVPEGAIDIDTVDDLKLI